VAEFKSQYAKKKKKRKEKETRGKEEVKLSLKSPQEKFFRSDKHFLESRRIQCQHTKNQ
jgi:hypothetical protein